ncbi:methane/ammonia monooxygenase subunit A [Bradyrhizobium niftali]|jgi:methane/ammonia monooxygenase subunit A|uniref:bacterial ammonia monooxygenase, subunit AmoA n=1 Tax=Bradyrhizobium niftali TaxID=2560055 RepID=UPI003839CD3F
MQGGTSVRLYGLEWPKESARISRVFDLLVAAILFLAVSGAFHLHYMLTAGDWDMWIDWKDRQWWVTLTPIMAITFPAALQYVFWTKFRLPIAATFAVVCLLFGQWINRYFGFHLWSYFPMSEVIPALLIPGALVLDVALLLTGNFLFTAMSGAFAFALLFYPTNWFWLAPYRLPVEVMGQLVSVGDYISYAFTRTALPEYIRLIERGTLRTFGGHSAIIASFFSAFVSILMYLAWWHIGMLLARVVTTPNTLKNFMGLTDKDEPAEAAQKAIDGTSLQGRSVAAE